MNINSGLAGLTLLGADTSWYSTSGAGLTVESKAVREAKAQFTLPETTPPWREAGSTGSISTQIATIRRLATIIDKPLTGVRALPTDVQSAFTTWKALDRLNVLATTAAKPGLSTTERGQLAATFAKGLADLQTYMGTAPSDKLELSFGQPVRRAESTVIAPGTGGLTVSVSGKGVVAKRDEVLSQMSGTERFRVTLERGSSVDTVVIDLGSLPEPPTLDSVASLVNQAIANIPMRDAGGNIVLNSDGTPAPKWKVNFEPKKTEEDGWTMGINRQGLESVSIDQVDAPDALIVATGRTGLETPTAARVLRIDDPEAAMTNKTLTTIEAKDRLTTKAVATTTDAVATDADGFAYVVGTASGDLDELRAAGTQDLYLTKMDSVGNVVWQRALGAADSASGAAVTVAENGDIVVAGTVSGSFNGTSADADMLVARYANNGDEMFASRIRSAGEDRATSIAIADDGAILVGGRAGQGGGDAFVARLSGTGAVTQRVKLPGAGDESITAMAMTADGRLAALTKEGATSKLRFLDPASPGTVLDTIDLGAADARAIAMAPDGSIAIGGTTLSALPGTQVNGITGGRDGFAARLAADGTGMAVTYLGTGGNEQVDSLAFSNGKLYVGGRTTGDFGGTRSGPTDGFIARIDPASGGVEKVTQFGQPTLRTEPVRVAASDGGSSKVDALGLGRGVVTPDGSLRLTTGSSLREGDSFQMRVAGGVVRTITIAKEETLASLADKVRKITGSKALVTTPKKDDGAMLRVAPKAGIDIEFIAGPNGRDALEKLGLPAARVSGMDPIDKNAPRVRPGGSFGLGLNPALSIVDQKAATATLAKLKSALSIAQTGYRSLYWDDGKQALVEGARGGGSTAREQAQMANYQAALTRLTSGPSTSIGF
ncbi:hypothetical protein [Sphingomonas sp.]|uniref:hypothetical protein n=1 Tax=Sphingomonas sp. TaxID=28214 RepID=UPI0017BECD70|nr:hypothetical protein [Sphingomonas sp.]MBA4761552.1 hypothetical protein [Sphingomonas sp.]